MMRWRGRKIIFRSLIPVPSLLSRDRAHGLRSRSLKKVIVYHVTSLSIMANLLNVFTSLGQLLTPPPAYTDFEYDGLEYRWKVLVFRPARESRVQVDSYPGSPVYVTTSSFQEGSLDYPRSPHICPRLVHWKVDQRKDRQQLVRFPSHVPYRDTSS